MKLGTKIAIAFTASVIVGYGITAAIRYQKLKGAVSRYQSNQNDVKKNILINKILISKYLPITDENIQKYEKYSVEELQQMLDE